MAYSNNGTITSGGAAQNILAEGHSVIGIVFHNTSDADMRVNVNADASAGAGTLLAAGISAHFGNLLGQRVSVYGATTGKAFQWREALGSAPTELIADEIAENDTLHAPSGDVVHAALALKFDIPVTPPEVPAEATLDDVIAALVELGLITQAGA